MRWFRSKPDTPCASGKQYLYYLVSQFKQMVIDSLLQNLQFVNFLFLRGDLKLLRGQNPAGAMSINN